MLHSKRHYTHYNSTRKFQRPWCEVVSALWVRYPNPQSKHVLSDDTISRQVIDGKLVTKRLIAKTTKLPGWASKLVGGARVGYIVEESVMNPKRKEMVTYSRTITMPWVLQVIEKSTYTRENRNTTTVFKDAWFSSQVYGFASLVQSFSCHKYVKSIKKSENGLQYVLDNKFLPPRSQHSNSL